MIGKKYTPIENWIWDNLPPEESDSAHQTYENMIAQGGGRLPVINQPLNLRDPLHFSDEARIQEIALLVKDAKEVLDLGCGDGWPCLRIAPYVKSVIGIDAAPRRVEVGRTNAERLKLTNVRIQLMSATELDFADNSFDAVVAASSIEQTNNPLRVIEQVFRVLRPGGRFVIDYESFDRSLGRPLVESVRFEEHADGSLGWHYSLKHRDPPWERSYLLKFEPTPEMSATFAEARVSIERVGSNPFEIPELGIQFLETNKALVKAGSYYELEHFSGRSMMETLEDAGFAEIKTRYSAGRLARALLPRLEQAGLNDEQLLALCQGLAQVALELPAPLDQGEPVIAVKPMTATG